MANNVSHNVSYRDLRLLGCVSYFLSNVVKDIVDVSAALANLLQVIA
jgi:hypothetical protein